MPLVLRMSKYLTKERLQRVADQSADDPTYISAGRVCGGCGCSCGRCQCLGGDCRHTDKCKDTFYGTIGKDALDQGECAVSGHLRRPGRATSLKSVIKAVAIGVVGLVWIWVLLYLLSECISTHSVFYCLMVE